MKILTCSLLAVGSLSMIAQLSAQTPAQRDPMPAEVMDHAKAPGPLSEKLVVTALDGTKQVYSADDIKNMTHITVTVHNAHSNLDETYSGVPVGALVKRATPQLLVGGKPTVKPLMTVIVFGATDNYHVVYTTCDIDNSCHKGSVIIADSINGKSLEKSGLFRLVSTEDLKPQRWIRNLSTITLKAVAE